MRREVPLAFKHHLAYRGRQANATYVRFGSVIGALDFGSIAIQA